MKNLLFLLTTICCLGSVCAAKDSIFYQIEDYFLDQKVDSARLLVERIEVLENEHQERVKAIVLSEIVSYSDYHWFIIHVQGNRLDIPYQRISEFIDREIIMPSDKKVLDYSYVKIKWSQISKLRNLLLLDEASSKNENLQEYVNQFNVKKRDVKRAQILVDNHKSVLLLIQENVEEGLSFAKQNERIARELKDTNLIILNLFQQADFLILTGNLDQYITISENSLRLDQLLKEKSPMYRSTIFHLVDAYIYKRGNEDRVRELLTELGQSPFYQLETVSLYGKILNFADPEKTDIQFVLDRFNAATVLEASEKALEETQGSEDQNAFFRVVNEFAGALSNYGYSKDAQRYYSRAISTIREIYSQKLSKSLANFENTQIRNEKVQAVAQEQEQVKLYSLISILAVGLLLIVIFALVKKQKQAELLSQKNEQINKALGENKLLLKEMHHRVKNNFLTVSSLLELQSKDIEDVKAKELAEEGQNRVKSMGLIHEKLCKNDDFEIDFNKYVQELVLEITKTYGQQKDTKISYKMDENLTFDIDTATPLGLIVNELITNAFKYGGAQDQPEVHVEVRRIDNDFHELIVQDNGNGLPAGFDLKSSTSVGLRLVKKFSRQLHGEAKFEKKTHSVFRVLFKDSAARMLVD